MIPILGAKSWGSEEIRKLCQLDWNQRCLTPESVLLPATISSHIRSLGLSLLICKMYIIPTAFEQCSGLSQMLYENSVAISNRPYNCRTFSFPALESFPGWFGYLQITHVSEFIFRGSENFFFVWFKGIHVHTARSHLLATGQLTGAFHPYYVSQWDGRLRGSYSTLSKQFSNLFKGEIVVPTAQV